MMLIVFREKKKVCLYCDNIINEMYIRPHPIWQDGSGQAMLIVAKMCFPEKNCNLSKLP